MLRFGPPTGPSRASIRRTGTSRVTIRLSTRNILSGSICSKPSLRREGDSQCARQCDGLSQEKRELETVWETVQGSAGWRLLNRWRRVREQLAPPESLRRRLYDSVIGTLRKRKIE